MRTRFIQALTAAATEDERIWLVNGDLGFSVLEAFRDRFPARYVNAGVAEQNMTGVAAGLALAGKIPVTYSIANFPTFRCLEQVRNDVGYHNLNVKIVSVGGGYAYGSAGYTHHALEDLAIMSAIPNMVVLAPADPIETELATRAMLAHSGPCYLRLGKANEAAVHEGTPAFAIGRGIWVRQGADACLLSTGAMLATCLDAARLLEERGVSAGVASMPSVRPLDTRLVRQVAATCQVICTVEEHGPGGLGSAVAEVIATADRSSARLVMARTAGTNASERGGSQVDMRAQSGLSANAIAGAVLSGLNGDV